MEFGRKSRQFSVLVSLFSSLDFCPPRHRRREKSQKEKFICFQSELGTWRLRRRLQHFWNDFSASDNGFTTEGSRGKMWTKWANNQLSGTWTTRDDRQQTTSTCQAAWEWGKNWAFCAGFRLGGWCLSFTSLPHNYRYKVLSLDFFLAGRTMLMMCKCNEWIQHHVLSMSTFFATSATFKPVIYQISHRAIIRKKEVERRYNRKRGKKTTSDSATKKNHSPNRSK